MNALDKDKKFTQVHYMKGFFFLKCVETDVLNGGRDEMLSIIRKFIAKYSAGAYITVFSLPHTVFYYFFIFIYIYFTTIQIINEAIVLILNY